MRVHWKISEKISKISEKTIYKNADFYRTVHDQHFSRLEIDVNWVFDFKHGLNFHRHESWSMIIMADNAWMTLYQFNYWPHFHCFLTNFSNDNDNSSADNAKTRTLYAEWFIWSSFQSIRCNYRKRILWWWGDTSRHLRWFFISNYESGKIKPLYGSYDGFRPPSSGLCFGLRTAVLALRCLIEY